MDRIILPEAIGSAKAVIETHEGSSKDGEMGMRGDSNCEDGQVGKNMTPDLAASMSESRSENGLVGKEMTPDRAVSMSKSRCINGLVGNVMTSDPAASIDEQQKDSESSTHEAEHPTNPSPNDMEVCPHGPGHEVAKDKEWVMIMASNLKQRGKGEVWVEVVETWVLLQRMWDRVEVCSFYIDLILYPMSSLWGAGPLQRQSGCEVAAGCSQEVGKVVW